MGEEKLVPELRFPEFNGEWERQELGEMYTFSRGKGIPKAKLSDTGNKCILYGQLYTIYNEVIKDVQSYTEVNKDRLLFSKKNDLLLPSSGETALDMSRASALLLDEIALGGDINVLRPEKDISSIFVSYQLNSSRKIDIAKISEGTSVVHLYNSNLKNLKISTTSLEEQNKIANFLSTLDARIEQQERKVENLEEKKKGIMQKVFSQEIRFKDDEGMEYGDWEEKRLKTIGEIYQPETISIQELKGGKYRVFGANGYVGYHNEYNHKNEQVSISCRGENSGNVNFTEGMTWITGNSMVINLDDDISITKEFLYYMLKSQDLRYLVTGSGQPQITRKDLYTHKILVPVHSEQQKIANFLSTLDSKREKEKEKLKVIREKKKGLLQRMFV